jgi:hypothetical protein
MITLSYISRYVVIQPGHTCVIHILGRTPSKPTRQDVFLGCQLEISDLCLFRSQRFTDNMFVFCRVDAAC